MSDLVDMFEQTCLSCKRGTYVETYLKDHWDWTLHCSECNTRIDRWTSPKVDEVKQLRDALESLYLLIQHETGLPKSAANGVVGNCGTDEGVYRAGMIIEEARILLETKDDNCSKQLP